MLWFVVLMVATGLAPVVAADICNDINDLSNGWNAIANALEQNADEDVGDLDVAALERDVNALLGPTERLGEALVDLGNRDEEDLGNDLLDVVDDLVDVDGNDLAAYLVDVIDDLVTTLDDVVDYCDQQ
jgi:hypothetical protein